MAGGLAVGIDVALVVVGIPALWYGAQFFVVGAVRLARRLGVPELVIGLTVVAVGTSAPEFAVTVEAALTGAADIAVGNVVGSNVFNLGFVLGGVALVSAIPTTDRLVRRDGGVLVFATLAVLAAAADLTITRLEGGALFGVLVAYLGYLLWRGEPLETDVVPPRPFRWTDGPRLLGGLALIVFGGQALVTGASDLAALAGVSEWVIGVTLVAAGTSAPELATSMAAARRGRQTVAVGNLLGSDVFNLLGVLGAAALIRPLEVDPGVRGSMLTVVGVAVLVVVLFRTGREVSRREGAVLVAVALARWALDFLGG